MNAAHILAIIVARRPWAQLPGGERRTSPPAPLRARRGERMRFKTENTKGNGGHGGENVRNTEGTEGMDVAQSGQVIRAMRSFRAAMAPLAEEVARSDQIWRRWCSFLCAVCDVLGGCGQEWPDFCVAHCISWPPPDGEMMGARRERSTWRGRELRSGTVNAGREFGVNPVYRTSPERQRRRMG